MKEKRITPGVMNIEVLEPIDTRSFSIERLEELMELVRGRMQETFDRLSAESNAKIH